MAQGLLYSRACGPLGHDHVGRGAIMHRIFNALGAHVLSGRDLKGGSPCVL